MDAVLKNLTARIKLVSMNVIRLQRSCHEVAKRLTQIYAEGLQFADPLALNCRPDLCPTAESARPQAVFYAPGDRLSASYRITWPANHGSY